MNLIGSSDVGEDFDRIVVDFINSMYSQGEFIRALGYILRKNGYALNEDFCAFPDEDSPDEDMSFVGVMVGVGEETSIVNEDAFFRMIDVACSKYANMHPDDGYDLLNLKALLQR